MFAMGRENDRHRPLLASGIRKAKHPVPGSEPNARNPGGGLNAGLGISRLPGLPG